MSQHINCSHLCTIIVVINRRICSPTSLEHLKKSCSRRRPGPCSAQVRDVKLLKSCDKMRKLLKWIKIWNSWTSRKVLWRKGVPRVYSVIKKTTTPYIKDRFFGICACAQMPRSPSSYRAKVYITRGLLL